MWFITWKTKSEINTTFVSDIGADSVEKNDRTNVFSELDDLEMPNETFDDFCQQKAIN